MRKEKNEINENGLHYFAYNDTAVQQRANTQKIAWHSADCIHSDDRKKNQMLPY